MAEVQAFRGWRYRSDQAGPPGDLLAPPYDVISPQEAEALRRRSPWNIVHLELPQGSDSPDTPDSRYRRAGALFSEWQAAGVLAREKEPALYVYGQEFALPGGKRRRRLGLLAALRLEPYTAGVVLPHEQTFPEHKEDRYQLLRAARAQFSPIMGLYAADDAEVRQRLERVCETAPALRATADDGVTHSLWVRQDVDFVDWAAALLRDRKVFIADGHHRYETGLRYQAERAGELPPGAAWFDYILTYLIAMEDPGLALMPTHRLVRGLRGAAGLREALARHVQLATFGPDGGVVPAGRLRLVLAGGACDLILPEPSPLEAVAGERSAAWARLEVTLLHRFILPRILETGGDLEVTYTRDAEEARSRVASGEFQAAFLLPAPRVEQLRAIALAGERMPEKTTYFWPKAWAGLVIYAEGVM